MKRSILSLAVLSSLSLNVFAQDTSIPKFNQDFKVSAQIDPGCFLEAENINFGVLQMPLQDQSASSNMRIHCSKGSNLNIEIAYGDSPSSNKNGEITLSTRPSSTYEYAKIFVNGSPISSINSDDLECWQSYPGKLIFHSVQAQQFFGLNNISTTTRYDVNDIWGICQNNNRVLVGSINSHFGGSGILQGLSSGEQIKFMLSKPNSSNVWGSSGSAHSIVATGTPETIPMKANIKRSDNPTHRMTPDTYQSTLTVILTY